MTADLRLTEPVVPSDPVVEQARLLRPVTNRSTMFGMRD